MDRIEELNKSQEINLNEAFYHCINGGIIFNPTQSMNVMLNEPMSASVLIHHWNHSKFLPLLFQSFEAMDRKDIDVQFIITDSGSDDFNKEQIIKLVNEYQDRLKVLFITTDLSEKRQQFNEANPDGTFHGFPYISNMALDYCIGDIHMLCDSSNIVNKHWLRALCSPHYKYYNTKMAIKVMGADFTAESTVQMENATYSEDLFNLPHKAYGFEAGRGFGWSMKMQLLKELGGFNKTFSSCGGVDDELWYRMKLEKFIFVGHPEAKGFHRIHNEGYEVNKRKPNWAYKKLEEIYLDNTQPVTKLEQEHLVPLFEFKNY